MRYDRVITVCYSQITTLGQNPFKRTMSESAGPSLFFPQLQLGTYLEKSRNDYATHWYISLQYCLLPNVEVTTAALTTSSPQFRHLTLLFHLCALSPTMP